MSSSPYSQASKLLGEIINDGKSLKSVVYSSSKLKCSKSTYAQVCETVKHIPLLESIINHNNGELRKGIDKEGIRQKSLLFILLHELLFSKFGCIRGGGKVKRSIMKFEEKLKETRDVIVSQNKGKVNEDDGGNNAIIPPVFPRYIRVNTLKSSTDEVIRILKEQIKQEGDNEDNLIYADSHVPDLLVIKPTTTFRPDWHTNELVSLGKIVLQDKSSCFSALALVHGSNNSKRQIGDIIDACAAPGNKTSHLAALVDKMMSKQDLDRSILNTSNEISGKRRKLNKAKADSNVDSAESKIFAFDRSSSRISLLQKRLEEIASSEMIVDDAKNDDSQANRNCKKRKDQTSSSTSAVKLHLVHQDFLTVDPIKYPNVRSILLDPSCSGSGIVNTPDRFVEAIQENAGGTESNDTMKKKRQKSDKRVESLSNFQLVALKHAMSFPQVQSIVYSTCSVHTEENENVVAAALKETNETIDSDDKKWDIVAPASLACWPRRGKVVEGLSKEEAERLVRVSGLEDETNGFFVSYFERRELNQENTSSASSLEHSQSQQLVSLPNGIDSFYKNSCSKNDNDQMTAGSNREAKMGKKRKHMTLEKTKLHNGKAMSNHASKSKDLTKSKVSHDIFPKTTSKSPKQDDQKPDKSERKKAKAMAWKRKQRELKKQRLMKKK